jgi:tRNA-specific adenosine deaminase 1
LFALKPSVSFHFYVSQTPCGDASIFPIKVPALQKQINVADDGCSSVPPSKRAKVDSKEHSNNNNDVASTSTPLATSSPPTLIDDLQRTGADAVPGEPSDSLQPGIAYHTLGILRFKPGAGVPTRSHSCSDKLARWNIIGVQGAYLSNHLREPIFLSSITVSDLHNADALERALHRATANDPRQHRMRIHSTSADVSERFAHGKLRTEREHGEQAHPCGTSIAWNSDGLHEVIQGTLGIKLGAGKQHIGQDKVCSTLCPRKMFQQYMQWRKELSLVSVGDSGSGDETESNDAWSMKNITYQQAKTAMLTMPCFRNWSRMDRSFQQYKC